EESKQAISNELANEVHQLQTSPEAVEKVAREKFNLCKEGETVLHYETASPEGNSGKTE
ncbi:MAG: septum formation initiator family protein, partial [Victivallaceae bacterium]